MAEGKPRVLVADDDPQAIELMEDYLSSEFEVLTAADGEEALRRAETDLPTLILLDIHMPKLSGGEVCRRLKVGKKTQNIPIIIVTGARDVHSEMQVRGAGADDFVLKPVRKADLLPRVRSLASFHRIMTEREALPFSYDQNPELIQEREKLRHTILTAEEILGTALSRLEGVLAAIRRQDSTEQQVALLKEAYVACGDALRLVTRWNRTQEK